MTKKAVQSGSSHYSYAMILLLALANLTKSWELAVPDCFLSQRDPRPEGVVHLAPGHFAVLGRRGSCMNVTGLAGLHKISMVLMQRYGTVRNVSCPQETFWRWWVTQVCLGAVGPLPCTLNLHFSQPIDLFSFSLLCCFSFPALVHLRWAAGNSVAVKHILMDWL